MLVYSKKIINFIFDIKSIVKEVLSQDVKLSVYNDFFYDRLGMNTYPINIVIYNDKCDLGYFDADFIEMGFHERLMYVNKDQLRNIIKHEVAHYITFINYGRYPQPHGPEFKAFCQRMGWGEEVSKSTVQINDLEANSPDQEHHILRKIQKLMALGSSSNSHEAELAILKSQELLLKHNIENINVHVHDDEMIFLKRVLKEKRKTAKLSSIASILSTFFVSPVFSRQEEFTYLEIVGTHLNIQIADYVACYLDHHLEALWDETRKNHIGLKGKVAKNSFFIGIAQGYCSKINIQKKSFSHSVSQALMILSNKLTEAKKMVYPRLHTTKSHAKYCPTSSQLGQKAGTELVIKPAVSSTKNSGSYLTY